MDTIRALTNAAIIQALRIAYQDGEFKEILLKTVPAFTSGLWRAVREFYDDDIDAGEFIDRFVYWIDEQLNRAWNQGAREVGVDPEEFEQEDIDKIQEIINAEYEFVLGFAEEIEAARLANRGYEQFRGRVDIWANRYNDVVNQARVWFGGREKLEWVLGATEKHCDTCSRLNGIIAYGREWEEAGVMPQGPPNEKLECGGWQCDCNLIVTTERRSRGALARIMGIAK